MFDFLRRKLKPYESGYIKPDPRNSAPTPSSVTFGTNAPSIMATAIGFSMGPPIKGNRYLRPPKDERGIYFLFQIDYEGAEHIGIFHTIGEAVNKWDEVKSWPGDEAIIYVMGKTKLEPYLQYTCQYSEKTQYNNCGWRKAKR